MYNPPPPTTLNEAKKKKKKKIPGGREYTSSFFCVPSCFSCVQLLATPWTVAHQAPLSLEFSRQEYWSGLPCPPPGDLSNPGIEPRSPALQADSLPSEPPRKHEIDLNLRGLSYNRNHFEKFKSWRSFHLPHPPFLSTQNPRQEGKGKRKEGKDKSQDSTNEPWSQELVGQTFYCDLLIVKHSTRRPAR